MKILHVLAKCSYSVACLWATWMCTHSIPLQPTLIFLFICLEFHMLGYGAWERLLYVSVCRIGQTNTSFYVPKISFSYLCIFHKIQILRVFCNFWEVRIHLFALEIGFASNYLVVRFYLCPVLFYFQFRVLNARLLTGKSKPERSHHSRDSGRCGLPIFCWAID